MTRPWLSFSCAAERIDCGFSETAANGFSKGIAFVPCLQVDRGGLPQAPQKPAGLVSVVHQRCRPKEHETVAPASRSAVADFQVHACFLSGQQPYTLQKTLSKLAVYQCGASQVAKKLDQQRLV
jgi:hypothetical protein